MTNSMKKDAPRPNETPFNPHVQSNTMDAPILYHDPVEVVNMDDAGQVANLIVIKQPLIIEERLKQIGDAAQEKINYALSLPCDEGTIKHIKKLRAELRKEFDILESARKDVNKKVAKQLEPFTSAYKQYISDPYTSADLILKDRSAAVEDEQKQQKRSCVERYFNEYKASKEIDIGTFDDAKIVITLTASEKSLKDQAKTFIDKIADDLALIETQEYRNEILVEYRASLNVSKAITEVTTRNAAVSSEKARNDAKKQECLNMLSNAKPHIPPPLSAPIVEEEDPVKTIAFTVTAPLSKLRQLKQYLNDGGYTYE